MKDLLYGTKDLFYGTAGPTTANIAVVGEAWGDHEENRQKPFVGPSGQELARIFNEAGFDFEATFRTNLVPARPGMDNDFSRFLDAGPGDPLHGFLRPNATLRAGLDTLFKQLDTVKPRLIVACGNYPMWALTTVNRWLKGTDNPKSGPPIPNTATGIGDYRGSQLYRIRDRLSCPDLTSIPVLPIYHPSAILREWSLRPITVHDLRTRVPLALDSDFGTRWEPPSKDYIAPPTYTQAVKWLNDQLDTDVLNKPLVLDIENLPGILTCIGFATSSREAVAIPFVRLLRGGQIDSYWTRREEMHLLKLLSVVLKVRPIIGQNLIYDMQWIWDYFQVAPKIVWDTMVAQHVRFPGTPKSLGYLSSIYCAHHKFWKDDNHEWDKTGTLEQHLSYNCEDTTRTYEIANAQRLHLGEGNLTLANWEFELDKLNLSLEMNRRAMRRDMNALADASLKITVQMEDIARRLAKIVPQHLVPTKAKKPTPWYRSDSQIKYVLYDLFMLPEQIDRKTKRPTVGKEAMAKLKEMYPRLGKLFTMLADYGSLDTLYSTFIKAKGEPLTNRFRASFNPAGTETFRWSSSRNAMGRGGNFQNIPSGSDE
jgi:uracil-DNA glycosylase